MTVLTQKSRFSNAVKTQPIDARIGRTWCFFGALPLRAAGPRVFLGGLAARDVAA